MVERFSAGVPLFSVCIPQYNRTSFLLVLLSALRKQTFRQVEICISDGGSTDGRNREVVEYLRETDLAFRYIRSDKNLPYDCNLRASLALARGRYCLLFGNDDTLADLESLSFLADTITAWGFPEVVITNYLELSTGTPMRRVTKTGILGKGPEAALANFRNFSFVSGILLDRLHTQELYSEDCDGTEMYQMYLGCRILALGGRLLGVEQVLVHKDVQIPGEVADSYARRPRLRPRRVIPRYLPLGQYGLVALRAIAGGLCGPGLDGYALRVFQQVLLFTYPPWLVEYRRVQSWRFAVGVALGMRPGHFLRGCTVSPVLRVYLSILYVAVSIAGLLVPIRVFTALRPCLHRWAKR